MSTFRTERKLTTAVVEETILRRGKIRRIGRTSDGKESGLVRDDVQGKTYFFWANKFKTPAGSYLKPQKGDEVVFLIGKIKGDWVAVRLALEGDYDNGVVNFNDYLSRFR